ncbi:hypothetical protein OCU04_011136 [Sclerotinia nivalis]|uniref:Uncharacterized protein n=1 Tax=Sclerotinia nivalis TaxID=352851 RepID=A0A9X0DEE9_9HELO|nr:hypothetical protein OCU04_011136 [Sclerotinia nivalis]
MKLSLVNPNHYASILAEARSSVQVGYIAPGAITPPERAIISGFGEKQSQDEETRR